MEAKIKGGKDTILYLGDEHRKILDEMGERLSGDNRGNRSMAARQIIENAAKGE